MQQIIFCVTYITKASMRESFIQEILSSGILEQIRQENGCVSYEYYRSVQNENEVLLIEKWATAEDQQIHLKQPHMETLQAIKSRYVQDTRLEKALLLSEEESAIR